MLHIESSRPKKANNISYAVYMLKKNYECLYFVYHSSLFCVEVLVSYLIENNDYQ